MVANPEEFYNPYKFWAHWSSRKEDLQTLDNKAHHSQWHLNWSLLILPSSSGTEACGKREKMPVYTSVQSVYTCISQEKALEKQKVQRQTHKPRFWNIRCLLSSLSSQLMEWEQLTVTTKNLPVFNSICVLFKDTITTNDSQVTWYIFFLLGILWISLLTWRCLA